MSLPAERCDYRHEVTDQGGCVMCWVKGRADPDCYPLFVKGRREDSTEDARALASCRARHIRPARESWVDKPIGTDKGFIVGLCSGLACGLIIGAVLL